MQWSHAINVHATSSVAMIHNWMISLHVAYYLDRYSTCVMYGPYHNVLVCMYCNGVNVQSVFCDLRPPQTRDGCFMLQ